MELLNITTTIRNPNRLIDFLRTLQNLNGEEWNHDNQELFQVYLIKERKYKPTRSGLSDESINIIDDVNLDMTLVQAWMIFNEKDYRDPSMRGRTSFAPLKEFGLARILDGRILITEQGEMLLNDEIDFQTYYLKWAVKWQFPNPMTTKLRRGTNVRPLIALLHLISRVNTFRTQNGLTANGITKYEFSIFGLSLLNYENIENVALEIVAFRDVFLRINNTTQNRRVFFEESMDHYLNNYTNFSHTNVRDYSDNILRYYMLTDLIRIRGGGFYIDISDRNREFVDWLLENYDGSSDNYDNAEEYISFISNINVPNLDFHERSIVENIRNSIMALRDELGVEIQLDDNLDLRELRVILRTLYDLKYKSENSTENGIQEVIDNLSNIRRLELRPALALEYWTSRALLILNSADRIQPNFITDNENNIVFTASGNKGDIECFYRGFNVLCEVTMLGGRNQWYNEGQPVMRHLRDFNNRYNVTGYCLFIAPSIHRDTLNTFWQSVKYEYEGERLNIIPISIQKFIDVLLVQLNRFQNGNHVSSMELENLYSRISDVENINRSTEWVDHIGATLTDWINNM